MLTEEKPVIEEHVLIDVEATTVAPLLRYIKSLPKDDLEKMALEYKKSPAELDELISQNKKIYYLFYGDYWLANYGSCLLYIYFPISIASAGLSSVVQEFDATIRLPSWVDYSFNWPMAITYVIYDMATFSVVNEALKSTLYVKHQRPLPERLAEAFLFARENPRQASHQTTQFLIHQAILLPTNATGVMSELVFLPLDYSQSYNQAFVVAVLFFGNEYFRKYTNVEYYEGVDFFFGDKPRPWMIRERSYTTLIMALFRWVGAVGLSVYPLYFYLALASEQTLGFWAPAYYIAVTKSIQSTLVLYPSTYSDYMSDYERVLQALQASPQYEDKMLELLSEKQLADTAVNRQQMLRLWRLEHQQACIDEISEQHGRFIYYFLKQNYVNCFLVLFRTGLGLYFGYGIAELLWDEMPAVAADVVSMLLCTLLIGQIAYYAERERFLDQYQANQLAPLVSADVHAKTDWVADVLNVAGNWISSLQVLGSLQVLTGNGSPQLTTIVTLMVLERMLNSINFNRQRVRKSVQSYCQGLPAVSEYCGAFFRKALPVQAPAPVPVIPAQAGIHSSGLSNP